MATEIVTIWPGETVVALGVTVTVGVAPPEWQPLQPSEAMPFLCAWAVVEASETRRPAAIPNPDRRLKIGHTIGQGRPAGSKRLKYSGRSARRGIAPQPGGDLVGEQESGGREANTPLIDEQPPRLQAGSHRGAALERVAAVARPVRRPIDAVDGAQGQPQGLVLERVRGETLDLPGSDD